MRRLQAELADARGQLQRRTAATERLEADLAAARKQARLDAVCCIVQNRKQACHAHRTIRNYYAVARPGGQTADLWTLTVSASVGRLQQCGRAGGRSSGGAGEGAAGC